MTEEKIQQASKDHAVGIMGEHRALMNPEAARAVAGDFYAGAMHMRQELVDKMMGNEGVSVELMDELFDSDWNPSDKLSEPIVKAGSFETRGAPYLAKIVDDLDSDADPVGSELAPALAQIFHDHEGDAMQGDVIVMKGQQPGPSVSELIDTGYIVDIAPFKAPKGDVIEFTGPESLGDAIAPIAGTTIGNDDAAKSEHSEAPAGSIQLPAPLLKSSTEDKAPAEETKGDELIAQQRVGRVTRKPKTDQETK